MRVGSTILQDDSNVTNYGLAVLNFINGLENDPFASLSVVQCVSDTTTVYMDLKSAIGAIIKNKNVTGLINAIEALNRAR